MSVAMHCAKSENLAEKSIPDPYDYKELVTTEQQPKMVREGLWDFGKAAFGWLEFRGLPAGEYEVVLGEMTNAAGCVANPYPNSSENALSNSSGACKDSTSTLYVSIYGLELL